MENLQLAYHKARKHKSQKPSVREFDKHWQLYLVQLMNELKAKTYVPRPLTTFILRDPKTRKICKSDFRDRVIHHALVNVLQPIFEPRFIHDSYASRKSKGTLAALRRFDIFLRKVTRNGTVVSCAKNANVVSGFALKADIKHYFDTVDHELELHPTKCKIIPLAQGVSLLGFRTFYHHKLVTQRNIRKINQKLASLMDDYEKGITEALDVLDALQGWNAYAMHGNTYHLRNKIENIIQTELEARTKTRNKISNK